jgi:hypothetical protein
VAEGFVLIDVFEAPSGAETRLRVRSLRTRPVGRLNPKGVQHEH